MKAPHWVWIFQRWRHIIPILAFPSQVSNSIGGIQVLQPGICRKAILILVTGMPISILITSHGTPLAANKPRNCSPQPRSGGALLFSIIETIKSTQMISCISSEFKSEPTHTGGFSPQPWDKINNYGPVPNLILFLSR